MHNCMRLGDNVMLTTEDSCSAAERHRKLSPGYPALQLALFCGLDRRWAEDVHETEQQLSVWATQPPRSKQKAVSQHILQVADQSEPHTPAVQMAPRLDEASITPLLCSSDNLMTDSTAAACVPYADSQPAASATLNRRQ